MFSFAVHVSHGSNLRSFEEHPRCRREKVAASPPGEHLQERAPRRSHSGRPPCPCLSVQRPLVGARPHRRCRGQGVERASAWAHLSHLRRWGCAEDLPQQELSCRYPLRDPVLAEAGVVEPDLVELLLVGPVSQIPCPRHCTPAPPPVLASG